jgi:hypothetical protein
MKSVSNLISYLHEFFQNFSQSTAIYFELISFGVIFNLEITDKRRSPNRLASLVLTAPSPGPKPTVVVRAPRPSLPGRLRRCEHDHSERRPSSPFFIHGASSSPNGGLSLMVTNRPLCCCDLTCHLSPLLGQSDKGRTFWNHALN